MFPWSTVEWISNVCKFSVIYWKSYQLIVIFVFFFFFFFFFFDPNFITAYQKKKLPIFDSVQIKCYWYFISCAISNWMHSNSMNQRFHRSHESLCSGFLSSHTNIWINNSIFLLIFFFPQFRSFDFFQFILSFDLCHFFLLQYFKWILLSRNKIRTVFCLFVWIYW